MRIEKKVSEILNCLKRVDGNDIVISFDYGGVHLLIEGAYRVYLPYKYYKHGTLPNGKELKSLREKVRKAVSRLDKLKEKIRRKTGLKLERESFESFRFEYGYVVELPYAFRYKSKSCNMLVHEIGLSMSSDMKKFKIILIGTGSDYTYSSKAVYSFKTEEGVLKFFEKIVKGIPDIYRELARLKVPMEIEFSFVSGQLIWYYKLKIGNHNIGISPEYHFFQNDEYKEKISKEEWNKILCETLKNALIDG